MVWLVIWFLGAIFTASFAGAEDCRVSPRSGKIISLFVSIFWPIFWATLGGEIAASKWRT